MLDLAKEIIMYKYLFIVLIISVCIGQEEWIYYNEGSSVYRVKPDNLETELFMDSLSLLDISEDQETFLFRDNYNIYYKTTTTMDTLELGHIFYYARLTQYENEIIYYKPTIGQFNFEKIYSYSFDNGTTRLLADSLYRFINMYGLMSPEKNSFAYFKSDFDNSGSFELFVVDIQSGQETFATTIQMNVNMWIPNYSYWAMDNYIYLNITDNVTGTQLYKVHSSNSEIPLEQLTEEPAYLRLLSSYDTNLDKLLLASTVNTNEQYSVSTLWVYELDSGQISYIDSVEGGILTRQTWSMDKSKVAFGGTSGLWDPHITMKIYDFTSDTIIAMSDSAEPLFWLGGQEMGIKNNLNVIPTNYFLSQNFPNPFNPITTLKYELPEDSFVDVTVYDLLGNVVKNLINANQSSGYKSLQWDATNNQGEPVSAGIYLYKIQADDFIDTKKMILLK